MWKDFTKLLPKRPILPTKYLLKERIKIETVLRYLFSSSFYSVLQMAYKTAEVLFALPNSIGSLLYDISDIYCRCRLIPDTRHVRISATVAN